MAQPFCRRYGTQPELLTVKIIGVVSARGYRYPPGLSDRWRGERGAGQQALRVPKGVPIRYGWMVCM